MTSNELAHFSEAAIAPQGTDLAASATDEAMRRLIAEAQQADLIFQYADKICHSKLVPEVYRGKPEDATAAMIYGSNFGLSGMAALQNVFLVKGKPATFARVMLASVLAAGHEVWEEEATNDRVVWCGRRRGSDKVFPSEWTIERAKLAKYDSNERYRTNPIEMLRAKCQAEVCRNIAPELLYGMPYSKEELDLEPRHVPSERVSAPSRGVAGVRAKLGVGDEPAPAPEPQQEQAPVERASKSEINDLLAILAAVGIDGKDPVLGHLSEALGRPVASTGELTSDEVMAVSEQVLAQTEPAGEQG